nr:RecName: Full=AnmTX Sco 9a-1 [Stomphia coccinea]
NVLVPPCSGCYSQSGNTCYYDVYKCPS